MLHSSSKYVLKKDDFCSVLQFFNVPPIICAQKYKCKSMPDTDFFNQPILIAWMFFVLEQKYIMKSSLKEDVALIGMMEPFCSNALCKDQKPAWASQLKSPLKIKELSP